VGFHTNGLLLRREICDELVATVVDWITISIDAATAETYQAVRGGRFQTILDNLEELYRIKRDRATRYPRITFKYALMRRNVGELSRLVDLAVKYHVELLELHNLIVFPGQPELAGQSLFGSIPGEGRGFFAQIDAQISEVVHKARRVSDLRQSRRLVGGGAAQSRLVRPNAC
jgi:MoaA/NifB/PqqE/SkfB family radical SAM enzyme